MRAVDLALDDKGAWHIPRHEDVGFQPGTRSIRRCRTTGVAGRWDSDPGHSQFRGPRNRQSQATRLKGASWVEGLIFDIEMIQSQALAQTLGTQEGGHALTQRYHPCWTLHREHGVI